MWYNKVMGMRWSFPGIIFLMTAMHLSAGGVSEEVHTSFKAGPGYEVDGDTCFLLTYHLYKVPEGVRRFPDGGISKTVFLGTYLMKLDNGAAVIEKEFPGDPVPMNRVPYAWKETVGSGVKADGYDMNVTNRLLRSVGPAACGLPSPLDYMDKKSSLYLRDLVSLKGDLQYRKEIIRTMVPTSSEAEDLLDQMDSYEKRLDGLELTEYRIFAEVSRQALKEKAGMEE